MRKKNKGAKRSSASYKNSRVKSEKISDYKYDQKPSVIMKDSAPNENTADRELKLMMRNEGFRSAGKVPQTNKRRHDMSAYKGSR